jgi:hypothetical protein
MATMNFDPEDTALIALVAFAAAVMAGLGSFSAFDVSLSDTFQAAGGTFSYAYLVTAGAFAWTVITNDMDLGNLRDNARDQLDDYYYWALMGSIVVLVAWPFVDGVSSFVTSQDLWGVLFIAGSVGAQVAIGYMR